MQLPYRTYLVQSLLQSTPSGGPTLAYSMQKSAGIAMNYSTNYGSSWQASDIRVDTDNAGYGELMWPMVVTKNGLPFIVWDDLETALHLTHLARMQISISRCRSAR